MGNPYGQVRWGAGLVDRCPWLLRSITGRQLRNKSGMRAFSGRCRPAPRRARKVPSTASKS